MKRKHLLRAEHLICIRFFDFPSGMHIACTYGSTLQLEHFISVIIWRIHGSLSAVRKGEGPANPRPTRFMNKVCALDYLFT